MPTDQNTWTPEAIFIVVRHALTDSLGLEEGEATLDSNIKKELGTESINILDVLFRIKSCCIEISQGELSPSFANVKNLERLLSMDQELLDLVASQFEGVDTSHLKLGGEIDDLYTVRFFCQVIAKKLGVTWEEVFVPAK